MSLNLRSPELNRLKPLFDGVDEGLLPVLPDEVTELRTALAVLRRLDVPKVEANEGAVAAQLLASARKGADAIPEDWPEQVFTADAARSLNESRQRVRDAALVAAAEKLVRAVDAAADDITELCLRPALAQVIEAVRPHAESGAALPWDQPARAFLPRHAETIAALQAAVPRYRAIRAGQEALASFGSPSAEALRFFGTLRCGIRAVHPTFGTNRERPAPWPADPAGRLAWLVANHGDDLWVPTGAECDDAYRGLVRENRLRQAPAGGVGVH